MNIKIRNARIEDMLTVYEQINDLEEKVLNMNSFQKKFKANIFNKNIIYLVAVSSNKEKIGFISCHIQDLLHHDKRVAEIQELYVDKKFRKLGAGSLLVKSLINKLKTKNCESLEVTAQNKRRKTHQFYSKIGFQQSHLKFIQKIA
jgi:PhnO protein